MKMYVIKDLFRRANDQIVVGYTETLADAQSYIEQRMFKFNFLQAEYEQQRRDYEAQQQKFTAKWIEEHPLDAPAPLPVLPPKPIFDRRRQRDPDYRAQHAALMAGWNHQVRLRQREITRRNRERRYYYRNPEQQRLYDAQRAWQDATRNYPWLPRPQQDCRLVIEEVTPLPRFVAEEVK